MIMGKIRHRTRGSSTCMRAGRKPNCKVMVHRLMRAKNFPINPARAASLGMSELSLTTKHTLRRAAKPCDARTSIKSARSVGTRQKRLVTFSIKPTMSPFLDSTSFLGCAACSTEGSMGHSMSMHPFGCTRAAHLAYFL